MQPIEPRPLQGGTAGLVKGVAHGRQPVALAPPDDWIVIRNQRSDSSHFSAPFAGKNTVTVVPTSSSD